MTDLCWTPAWRLNELMQHRKLSPVELMQATLDRLEELNPAYSMYITVDADRALDEAAASAERFVRDEALGPLDGLPVSVKDNVWTEGLRTTNGSLVYKDFVPDVDSTPVARLRGAGAIIFGKTNLPEFALYRASVNRLVNETRNAWNRSHTSGGSSGGSAVTVALGVGPVSIGTDGGGSIRLPASFNGIVGVHPSRGRVPAGPRTVTFPMQGIGPMTRDVRDAARFLTVMAPPDPGDFMSTSTAAPDYEAGLDDGMNGLRIAWSPDFGRITPADTRVVDVAYEAARSFGELGARFEEPSLRIEDPQDALNPDPPVAKVLARYADHPDYFGLEDLFAQLRADPAKWEQVSIYVKDRSLSPTVLEYTMSIPPDVRERPVDEFAELFDRYDLLVSPVISRTAFRCGETHVTSSLYVEYTQIVNVMGYAAASVPAGSVDGMPVGLQIIARPDEEALLLRACRALERARPWADIHPPV